MSEKISLYSSFVLPFRKSFILRTAIVLSFVGKLKSLEYDFDEVEEHLNNIIYTLENQKPT